MAVSMFRRRTAAPAPLTWVRRRRRARVGVRSETGAAAVEFALVAPLVIILTFGTIFVLLAAAAHVSVAHAASVGVRYASMPTDPVAGVYPDEDMVETRMTEASPFVTTDACTTTVVGDTYQNAVVTLDVSCPLANPLGRGINALVGSEIIPDPIELVAHGEARRE